MTTLSSDPRTLSHEAYLYLYPLVLMEVTRRQAVHLEPGARPGFGPPNQFHHIPAFPTAEFRAVVRPNFDTLYSIAWVDLGGGPVRVHAPDTDDRYYMLPMLDMWTDVFANPGKRTTGTGAQDFVLVGPGGGEEAEGDAPVIEAPTPWVWIIGRTQTNGPADYEAVHAVQEGYSITPLGPRPEHPIDPGQDTTTEPLHLVDAMSAVEFFTLACEALALNPPHPTDFSVLARIAGIGIVPGASFDPSGLGEEELGELEAGARAAREDMAAAVPHLSPVINGWTMMTDTVGVYGNHYLKRATVALVGLGANPAEDAIYPLIVTDADGRAPSGDRDYVIHFDADAMPPVSAFWSITMYDGEGFPVPNELDRFAIGDRDPLAYNPDGSLDIYVQRQNPGPEREANWLPAGSGPIGITMRLYAPERAALDGSWAPPPVRPAA